jgi:hypothetical protein
MKKFFMFIFIGIFYLTMSEMTAKKKAADFCNAIDTIESETSLLDKGSAAGARVKDIYSKEIGKNTKVFYVPFTGFYPGSDFICQITEENGKVVEKNPNIITSLHLFTS